MDFYEENCSIFASWQNEVKGHVYVCLSPNVSQTRDGGRRGGQESGMLLEVVERLLALLLYHLLLLDGLSAKAARARVRACIVSRAVRIVCASGSVSTVFLSAARPQDLKTEVGLSLPMTRITRTLNLSVTGLMPVTALMPVPS
jgi:hypothetical protein